jgi:hypothetical protein
LSRGQKSKTWSIPRIELAEKEVSLVVSREHSCQPLYIPLSERLREYVKSVDYRCVRTARTQRRKCQVSSREESFLSLLVYEYPTINEGCTCFIRFYLWGVFTAQTTTAVVAFLRDAGIFGQFHILRDSYSMIYTRVADDGFRTPTVTRYGTGSNRYRLLGPYG